MFVLRTFGDTLELIGAAAVIGAVTGFITSLTRPPAGRSTAVFGIDNRIRYPRRYRNKPRTRIWGIDLGSIGPALIGAGGGVFVVFATGVGNTEDPEVAGEIIDAIDYVQLVVLAIAGGAAGELVFRTLAAGGKVSLLSAQEAIKDSAAAAGEAVESGETPEVVEATALKAGGETLDSPDGNEEGEAQGLEPEDALRAMLNDPKFKARSIGRLMKASGTTENECVALLEKLGARQVTMRNGKPGWTLRPG